jgi:tetratricopeptide (TPR) repeat protein
MDTSLPAYWAALALILASLFIPDTAPAQGVERESAEISEAQQTLNDEGVRAMIEGDFAGAVALLERSIRMGENNVTYLNLGRAYQKLGNCEKARESLVMAKTAPAVEDPPESEVTARAEEFLEELDEECGEEPPVEDVDPVEIEEPDPSDSDGGDQDSRLEEPAEPIEQPPKRTNTLGIATLAPGVALIGTGITLHFVAQGQRNQITDPEQTNEQGIVSPTQAEAYALRDSANTYDTIGLGMVIGGGVLSALGTYFLLRGSGAEADVAALTVGATANGPSVMFRGRF